MRRLCLFFVAALSLFSVACSPYHAARNLSNQDYLGRGELLISRNIPAPQPIQSTSSMRAMGFLPGSVFYAVSGPWLEVDRNAAVVRLMNGGDVVREIPAEGVNRLQAGEFSVMIKQRSPLWYAPDSYFATRGLTIPKTGDQERYRRGALGEFAIFISETAPLHSGPIDSAELGGIRIVNSEDMSRVYYTLAVGSAVIVK